ncbi:PLP-dependent aminotransferase family protein [Bradyrhizobium japonicum]|uniref:MocR-like pyridoxine biosynthesis transcription factor PdxR n=1 Tax=Bradyrhizobium TaxID=374 RepID=UPI00190F2BD2|nr:PLP-dependent aminotransferase family protein [Bradyrhizobium japonicum]MBR0731599.1 PLP-dependent aminotransferase family protein [Bradyrhizobium japonicum]MBR0749361.1 PLP-dependent aminotransferase family protein [Bradyrhizobium japonicum]MCD9112629.1 PLP-dependent aminotransferase family protein [Bradyrhizobium japonicum]MCD9256936.1 PLP-dependent aminotransferase family protein [Bradyrhizobium japonicum SEMIA 5079]MCD9822194.1 PLP-dependent aminotransferase family protein [Bradyrhizobi
MMAGLSIQLDHARKIPLATQIYSAIREGIENGRLASGSRLPSWQNLAAQLGVSRGTVRVAYGRLVAEQFALGLGPAGTRVAARQFRSSMSDRSREEPLLSELFHDFGLAPRVFQMGVPSQDAFPFKLWSRLLVREAREAAALPVTYPDPRGDPQLRKEIAAYLALARGIRCDPSQVIVTGGFSGALGLVIQGLQLGKKGAWIEDPCFPLTRTALNLAGMIVTAVPVDAEGLDVLAGVRAAAGASLAVVTAGQQAPLGVTMSLSRRLALLAWARRNDAWIIEDDYLSELQLTGRVAPALASFDHGGRVLHVGSFSKTISPSLRLGFLVVPSELSRRFGELVACLAPAPAAAVQRAVAEFLRQGHYFRHLRRMKRLYATRRESLLNCLRDAVSASMRVQATGGLAVAILLPDTMSDLDIASRALQLGMAPTPLSPWYMQPSRRQGLLLGVTNLNERRLKMDCRRLLELAR